MISIALQLGVDALVSQATPLDAVRLAVGVGGRGLGLPARGLPVGGDHAGVRQEHRVLPGHAALRVATVCTTEASQWLICIMRA